jgi:hypothetical protein
MTMEPAHRLTVDFDDPLIGDDGILRRLDGQVRRFNLIGNTSRCKGTVWTNASAVTSSKLSVRFGPRISARKLRHKDAPASCCYRKSCQVYQGNFRWGVEAYGGSGDTNATADVQLRTASTVVPLNELRENVGWRQRYPQELQFDLSAVIVP